jgi:DHA2 family multidrug resistance protein-like MFS transporter
MATEGRERTMTSRESGNAAGWREWVGLAVVSLPALVVTMDVSILFLAVPSLTASLTPTASQLLWISDIYGFVIAGSLLTMGAVSDRVGPRRLLMVGASAFAAASLLAAFASTPERLIAARAILGLAGATLAPSSMAILRSMFRQERQRRRAIGVWMSCFAAGAAVGPLVGGALLEHFWWGSAFLLNVPVMVVLLVGGAAVLPAPPLRRRARLDLRGAVLSLVAVLLVTYALKTVVSEGLGLVAVVSLAAGAAVGGAFMRQQKTASHPLVDPSLLRTSGFAVCLVAIVLSAFVVAGLLFYMAQLLQLVVQRGPLEAGMWTLPVMVATITGSMSAPALLERLTALPLLAGALGLAGIGLAMAAMLSADDLTWLIAGSILVGLGAGAAGTIATDSIIGAAPIERAGAASAVTETGSELGGALGVALLGSLGTAVYRARVLDALPASLSASSTATVVDSRGGAAGIASSVPEDVLRAADAAFVDALQASALSASALCAIAAAVAVVTTSRAARRASSRARVQPTGSAHASCSQDDPTSIDRRSQP